jgi:NAD(P)-dependent dehydrogenase (short-subunit alcohol dehydrogenase family)
VLHRGGQILWNDLERRRRYSQLAVYAQSKLALTMFTRALARFWQHDYTAVSVHPGVYDSALLPLYGRPGRSPVDGAVAVARLCAPETKVVNGAYYDRVVAAEPSRLVEDARSLTRLWKLSSRLTGLAV